MTAFTDSDATRDRRRLLVQYAAQVRKRFPDPEQARRVMQHDFEAVGVVFTEARKRIEEGKASW